MAKRKVRSNAIISKINCQLICSVLAHMINFIYLVLAHMFFNVLQYVVCRPGQGRNLTKFSLFAISLEFFSNLNAIFLPCYNNS